MVRVPITLANLHAHIQQVRPNWLARATARTNDIRNGTRTRFTNMWSEIKQVYMDIQGPKCAFCEKWIEDQAIECDIEHFRPKNRVTRWNVPARLQGEGIVLQQPAAGTEPGYRLLAYHPLNYAAACKTCNSVFKRAKFPISGPRDVNGDDPTSMGAEGPYLIYPISDVDDAPEDLIEFHGITPQAKQDGFDRQRALVTIEMFRLNDWKKRKELMKDRGHYIYYLFVLLERRDTHPDPNRAARAGDAVNQMLSRRHRHSNCLRCFDRLYQQDPQRASDLVDKLDRYRGNGP